MADTATESNRALLDHVLVPVAHEDDARKTARALEPYEPGQVTVVHVVEKAGGGIDKTPVEHSKAIAADSFEAVRSIFPNANSETAVGEDVVETIFDTAAACNVSAIVYRARKGNRLTRFLSGDHTLSLVTQADRPVVALPQVDERDD